ncbi:hypothetical protein VTH82DRAFT_8080 [Thermothelomyces myriococcoides]
MAGPPSPGGEGPTFAPPPLPPGWIAQWDASSKKYYFVQLSTGVSQWETPTEPAPTGGTPAPQNDHPYGLPNQGNGSAEIIVHPDGSQTARYPDGRLEPVNPREDGGYGDGTRGIGGGDTDRGLGSLLGNTLSSLSGKQSSGGSHGGSGGLGGLAGQVVTGLLSSGSSGSQGGSHGSSGGIGGKLASQLASNLFSSGSKPSSQAQSYHGGQPSGHSSSGGLGGIVGGVANMLSGKPHGSSHNNFGYSNTGQTGGYSGPEPPISYQAPSQPGTTPSFYGASSSYHAPPQHQAPHSQYTPSYGPAAGHHQQQPPHTPGYGSPHQSQTQQPYGQPSYGAPPPVAAPYGQPLYGQPHYASSPGHSPYPPQPQYAAGQYHHGYGAGSSSGHYH